MILTALYITYLLASDRKLKTKVVHLLVATFILIASSLPWFVAVDSVSPEERPYVGRSENNSEVELATGYNGLGHFLGYGTRMLGRPRQTRPPISPQFQNGASSGTNANNLKPRNAGKLGAKLVCQVQSDSLTINWVDRLVGYCHLRSLEYWLDYINLKWERYQSKIK
ncbi:MAG: hypothetical protein H6Q70_3934 [Firmicutes bacterium]|nr:hypothetical protein [Bacillota bacterium]